MIDDLLKKFRKHKKKAVFAYAFSVLFRLVQVFIIVAIYAKLNSIFEIVVFSMLLIISLNIGGLAQTVGKEAFFNTIHFINLRKLHNDESQSFQEMVKLLPELESASTIELQIIGNTIRSFFDSVLYLIIAFNVLANL